LSLSYKKLQPGNPDSWDGYTNLIFIFGQTASQEIDINNIKISLIHISNFINNKELKNNKEEDIPFLKGFGQITFDFISSVFKGRWDQLKMEKNNKMFHELIKDEFTIQVSISNKGKKTNNSLLTKLVNFLKLSLLQLSPRPSKEVLEKSKFHRKNTPGKDKKTEVTTKSSYMQISSKNIKIILKIKENFPELLNKKIEELNKSIFNNSAIPRPRINITTKGPSCKQIIIPMGNDNAKKIINTSSEHITNLNQTLRDTKSDLTIDFIYIDHQGLIIISNRVVSPVDISIIIQYVKNCNNVDFKDIQDV